MPHLRAIPKMLQTVGLTASRWKCAIGRVSSWDRDGVSAISACPQPKSKKLKKQVRLFLGLANRQFILDFSRLTSPLTDLTRKGASDPVQWMERCQMTFLKISVCLCHGSLLMFAERRQGNPRSTSTG